MMTTEQVRADFLNTCPYPKSDVEALAHIILSVLVDSPDGLELELFAWEIARELWDKGYRVKDMP